MSYTAGVFYIDLESGSDTARTALLTCVISNPSGSVISVNKTAHGLVAGAVFDATLFSAWFNGAWKVLSVTDADNFIVDGVWQATADNNGTITPRGGSSKADAWLTITSGATAARTASGDTLRFKATPNPTSLGVTGIWTGGPLQSTKAIVSSTNATPIVVTLSGANYTALAPAVGDTVYITGHTTNTNANGCWEISAVNGSTTVTLINADGSNSVGNGAGGATGTIRKINNRRVWLNSAVNKTIALCGNQGTKTNWTASANVTCSVITSDFKEGGECQQVAVAAGFATGLAAYFATGTLDLSGYEQVTFWVKQTAGTAAVVGDVSLRLCTDTVGAVSVHTIAIPALTATGFWAPINVNLAGALNSAIKSVALYVDTDRGAVTFLLDCIQAVKASTSADSLNLTSRVGKNTATETWWGLQSINGKRLVLDMDTNCIPTSTTWRGYEGTTETVTTYKRETFKPLIGTNIGITQRTGVTYSGGWDRTNMTSQDGETWIDGQNSQATGCLITAAHQIPMSNISWCRWQQGLDCGSASSGVKLNQVSIHNCSRGAFTFGSFQFGGDSSNRLEFGVTSPIWICANVFSNVSTNIPIFGRNAPLATYIGSIYVLSNQVTSGIACSLESCYGSPTSVVVSSNNSGSGAQGWGIFGSITLNNNGAGGWVGTGAAGKLDARVVTCNGNTNAGFGITGSAPIRIGELTTQNNGTYGIDGQLSASNYAQVLIYGSWTSSGNPTASLRCLQQHTILTVRNWVSTDATLMSAGTIVGNFYGERVISEQHGGTFGDNRVYIGASLVAKTQTVTRHTASDVAWQLSPTSVEGYFDNSPLELPLAQFPVAANAQVTFKCWIRRDSTSLTAKLVSRGKNLAGIGTATSDASVTASGAVNTWAEETLTFTPTEEGAVEVWMQAYGGSTLNAYFDDVTISQA